MGLPGVQREAAPAAGDGVVLRQEEAVLAVPARKVDAVSQGGPGIALFKLCRKGYLPGHIGQGELFPLARPGRSLNILRHILHARSPVIPAAAAAGDKQGGGQQRRQEFLLHLLHLRVLNCILLKTQKSRAYCSPAKFLSERNLTDRPGGRIRRAFRLSKNHKINEKQ